MTDVMQLRRGSGLLVWPQVLPSRFVSTCKKTLSFQFSETDHELLSQRRLEIFEGFSFPEREKGPLRRWWGRTWSLRQSFEQPLSKMFSNKGEFVFVFHTEGRVHDQLCFKILDKAWSLSRERERERERKREKCGCDKVQMRRCHSVQDEGVQ